MAYNVLMLFFIILSFFDVFIVKSKKKKKLILILIFIIYLFFFGLRGFISWDWKGYYPHFINTIPLYDIFQYKGVSFNKNYTNFEIGYQIWVSFLRMFFDNWNTYLFFTTMIDISCLLVIFYKYSPYPVFSILLFLGFNGMQIQLDLMRNFKSMLIFLFSIEYLINKKYIKYLTFNMIGIFIHRSYLIYIIVGYFFKKNFYKYKNLLLSFFLFGVFFFLFSHNLLYEILNFIKETFIKFNIYNSISEKLEYYLSNSYSNSRGIGIGFLERILSFILFYIYRKKINKDKYGKIFFNIFLFYIFSYLYGSGIRIIFERLGLLFICSYWIIYPIILKNTLKLNKILIFIFLIVLCNLKINVDIAFNKKSKELHQYKNILWNKEIYEEKIIIFNKVLERFDRSKKRE